MAAESLSRLPPHSSWFTGTALEALPKKPDPAAWGILVKLALYQLDLVPTIQLDRHLRKLYPVLSAGLSTRRPVRLAMLGFAALDHLLPGMPVGALRRACTCPF